MTRIWRRLHKNMRKQCRVSLSFFAVVFAVVLAGSTFISASSDQTVVSTPGPVFGLDPELVKAVVYLLIIILGFFLGRLLVRVDRNQSVLFDNQRKLAESMSSIVTAHNINHPGQGIRSPELSDSGRE